MRYLVKKVLWCLALLLVVSIARPTTSSKADRGKDDLVEVSLVTILDVGDGSVLVLKSKKEERFLTIHVGDPETRAILLGLQRLHGKKGIVLERPLTHNLMLDTLSKLGARIDKIVVSDFRKDTFYADIFLALNGGKELIIDSRPSDAIALVVTMEKPVSMYVAKKVMDEQGKKELFEDDSSNGKKTKGNPIKL